MLTSLEVFLVTLGVSVPAYWAAGYVAPQLQTLLLAVVSAVLLYSLSPMILVVSGLMYILVLANWMFHRLGFNPAVVKALSWSAFGPLVLLNFIPQEVATSGLLGERAAQVPGIVNYAYLGASYAAIRSFLIVRESIASARFDASAAICSLLFFGSFVAGPIAGIQPFVASNRATSLTGASILNALSRMGWGAALLLVIAPWLSDFDIGALAPATNETCATWLGIYKDFLALYLDFTGYSSLAIGSALLYGITLPENFRMPLLARSIQEFWRRWHLSLGAFIGRYLFQPLVRHTGQSSFAIFFAFILVGLWHNISWPYLVWGIGHGAALSLNMAASQRSRLKPGKPEVSQWILAAQVFLTQTYVALLSKIANCSSLTEAVALLRRLVGF